jgi:hypothetical protein
MKSSSKTRRLTPTRKHVRDGDLIEVVILDRANGGSASNRRPKSVSKKRWRAVVGGPSVMGTGAGGL